MPRGEPTGRRGEHPEVPAALRRDVGVLGTLLGRVLAESGGAGLLEDVERLRKATIALRIDPSEDRRLAVTRLVDGWSVDRAALLARAFTVYFHLVNLAEERHRVRALGKRGRADTPVPDSIEEAVEAIRRREGEDVLAEDVGRLHIRPVLTAHPTEARRRSVTDCLRRIAELLAELDLPEPPRVRRAHLERRLLEEITTLWRTDQIRRRRPDPLDEVRTTMAVFDATIFRVVPLLYRELDRALGPEDVGTRPPSFDAFLRWGSWIGADRDGNPNVTAEVTLATIDVQAEHVLRGLEAVARRISRALTVSTRFTPGSEALVASLDPDERDFPDAAAHLRERFVDQPHRRKLALAAERLAATRTGAAGGYASPDAFVADLRLIQGSLVESGAARLAFGELQHLVWQAETFGFHLASLEVRQHSDVHTRALRELVPQAAGDSAALDRLALEGARGAEPRTGETAEVLATFRAIADVQRRHGDEACRRYVVSFTRSPADVVGVLALGRLAIAGHPPELDPVPLFESERPLREAAGVLEATMDLPGMAAWLEARDRSLEVMLGYSDSAKEIGFLAANVALHRAQADLAVWARRRGVALTLFHGRGGAPARGGGPAHRAILAQAAGSVAGGFKVTEQGEVVFARYGDLDIARRHLEQVTSAVLSASTSRGEERARAGEERFGPVLDAAAEASEAAYRELVGTPGFVEFFLRCTPMQEIEQLQVGSRPVRRAAGRGLGSLRAIPWVFAWTQSRVNLPGWFGLGTGLATVAERPGGRAELRAMHETWPFFRSLLENAELGLVIADLPTARAYLALGERPDLAAAIEDEYRRTVDLVMEVTGHEHLLAERPLLRRAVELRNPYVDALSFIQVRYLRELRSGGLDPDRAARAARHVLVTVNGIAAGLQNTG